MSNAFPVVVPVEETKPDRLYFIARGSPGRFMYYSRYLSGKHAWSVKPGIAIQCYGGEQLVTTFAKNKAKGIDLVAIEVPADAATRWRARKRKFS